MKWLLYKMRILHVIPGFGGGISTYVKNLITAPNHDDLIMDVVGFGSFPNDYIDEIRNSGGDVFQLPGVYREPFEFIRKYRFVLKEGSYDMIHCHISGYKGYVFKMIAKMNGVSRIAVHAHRTSDEHKGRLYGLSIFISQVLTRAFADYYFTCSDLAGKFIFGKNVPHGKKIYFVPNTINPDLYRIDMCEEEKKNYRKELQISDRYKILGHIGRFNIQKNHTFLIEVFEKLIHDNPEYILLLIGEGQLINDIRRLVESKGLTGYVRFLGRRDDIAKLLQIMDVVLLPSLYEGLPTVAVEAQAAGAQIIMSDTITRQTDLGMSLAKYLSITQGAKIWCDCIRIISEKHEAPPSAEKRMATLADQNFIASKMRERYKEIISCR